MEKNESSEIHLYLYEKDADRGDYYMKQEVKVVNAETREIIGGEIKHEGKLSDIQWNPEGSQLAFLAGNDIHDVIAGRIMAVSAKGGTPKNIYPDFKGKFD
ncbi:MAG: hypothetical protein ACLFPH_00360 [Bacteroidales bacterium]